MKCCILNENIFHNSEKLEEGRYMFFFFKKHRFEYSVKFLYVFSILKGESSDRFVLFVPSCVSKIAVLLVSVGRGGIKS